jgi:UDP-N-acetyl-D-galactosamine dehydrogenase
MIFRRLGIDTIEVLEAAETKWNFMPFRPGLVGGHCIGVDPYYLTHKAQSVGYVPDVILAGRRINRAMGAFVAKDLMMAMLKKRIHVDGSRVLILGVTFKENCPDIRNTRVLDISSELSELGVNIDFYDPWISQECLSEFCGENMLSSPELGCYDAVVLAVGHTAFKEMGPSTIRSFCKQNHIFYDVKGVFPKDDSDVRL